MLVLTRKINESIMIGDEVEICVLEVRGDKIRLGIKAPKAVPVHRKEVYDEIQRANLEAAGSKVEDLHALGRLIAEREKRDEPGEE